MSFAEIQLKKSYSSEEDDILFDFYLPVLKNSVGYDRISGFFSSTSLAIASSGIFNIIKNGGKMRLITCPRLRPDDIQVIKKAILDPEGYLSEILYRELKNIENEFVGDHLKLLGWMIANNKLEIRLALIYDENGELLDYDQVDKKGIFHQKIGIFYDKNGEKVSFSGSINESASGWLENIEEFKVFRSWNEHEAEYQKPDIEKFEKIWNGETKRIKIKRIPEAILENLIARASNDIYSIDWSKYNRKRGKNIAKNRLSKLFDHQETAVKDWISANKVGLFEMATGTGKTFTSLGCLDIVTQEENKWINIITCPQNHLVQQWIGEINNYGIEYEELIVADSTNPKWRDQLLNTLLNIHLGYRKNIIIVTTHRTFSSKKFIDIISENKKKTKILLIADEVHGLGSNSYRKGLITQYEMRIGLSATPKRWFDEQGTKFLYDYFGDVVFTFDLEKSLNTINPATGKTYLTPYYYRPIFVSLSPDELEDYIEKTLSIVRLSSNKESDESELIENILFARANIVKNVQQKYGFLNEILNKLKPNVKSTICFCSPQQINEVMIILGSNNIIAHRFTEKEGTKPEKKYGGISQRKYLLNKFTDGEYQMLVAIKCLDEGVDVPNAETAILMSSSTNPREYIQRIGRVIRRSPEKERATIYDFFVIPSFDKLPEELKKYEKKIFEKELLRANEIANYAINNAEAIQTLNSIKNIT